MLCPKVTLHAAGPSLSQTKSSAPPRWRAGEWNQTSSPLFRVSRRQFSRRSVPRCADEFLEKYCFSARSLRNRCPRQRGRLPHFNPLVAAVSFKSVEQREALDKPCVITVSRLASGKKGHHATEPNPRLRQAPAVRHCESAPWQWRPGAPWNAFHTRKVLDPQGRACSRDEAGNLLGRSRSNAATENAKPQKTAKVRPASELLPSWCNPDMSISILRRLARLATAAFDACARGTSRRTSRKGGVIHKVARKPQSYLTRRGFWVNCIFLYATMPQFVPSEVVHDLDSRSVRPLFLRPVLARSFADKLRRDIEVPAVVLAKPARQNAARQTRPAAS